MSVADSTVRELSAQDRQKLEELLGEFHRAWEEGRLERTLAELPVDLPYRLAAVTGLAAIDLEMRWQHGTSIRVEEYLQKYPELGTAENVSIELLLAEFFAQERYEAAPDLNAFLQRFPQQADDLRRLISLARSPRLSGLRNKSSGLSSHTSQPKQDGPVLPEQFDRYRILKKLGQGGMGTVYLAFDTRLDRKVALKVPRFAAGSDHENLERFYREARATATITHPNLCPLYDVGEINGIPYLTMGYIEGWPLSKFIRTDKLLPQFGVATVVRIVAQAVEEAHKRGVIHRDLKPGNIMINKRGEPIVMDFGLARWLNADKDDVRLTRSGAILGAPVYMSPEQVYGDVDAMGPGCDVYSLGVILYELLTGRLPFEGPTTAVLAKTLIQAPKPPHEHRADVDGRLEEICLKAMAKRITDRYATMSEIAAALTEYIRAERQAQTLTSMSMSKLTNAGSSVTLSGPLSSINNSSTSLSQRKKQAATATIGSASPGVQTEVSEERTPVLLADDAAATMPEVDLVKPPRSRMGLWLALAGVGAVAALLCIGLPILYLLMPHPPQQGPVVPSPAPGSLQIVLAEMPADAEVRLNGDIVERQRLAGPLQLTPGEYTVAIKASKFEPWSQRVQVDSGANPPLSVTLQPKEAVAVKIKEPQPNVPFEGHTGAVKSVAWSHDNRYLLSGSDDLSLRLWDAGTREVKQVFEGHTQPVTSVALSLDGTRALSGSGDGSVIYWDVATGKIIHRLTGHTDWVRGVALSPDGKWGLSGGDDKVVRLWNLNLGQEWKSLAGHTSTVWSVAFSRDGLRAVSGSEDRTVRVWDLGTFKEAKLLPGHTAGVRGVAFLPDGRVLSGSDDHTLRLWDTKSGAVLKTFTGHPGKVRGVALSSDGQRAVSAGFSDKESVDSTIRLWDVDKGTLLYGLGSAPQNNNAVAFSPNDRWVVSGGDERVIRLWDAAKATAEPVPIAPPAFDVAALEVRHFGAPKQNIDRVAVSKDGKFALSGGYDGMVRYWDLAQGRELRAIQAIPAGKGTVHYVAFSPDDRFALSCGDDKLACLWNLDTGELVKKFEGHTDKVWGAIFMPNGKQIVTCAGDLDKSARLWDIESGMVVKKFEGHTKAINAVAVSPDGKHLLTASWDGTLRVWDVDAVKSVHEFKSVGGSFSTVAFFPDGRRAVVGNGKKVRLFDVIDFKELPLVDDPHTEAIYIVAVSPGGRRILSAGKDKNICLWDVATGKVLLKYPGNGVQTPGVAFTPDGMRFLSGGSDSTLRLWELPRNLTDPPGMPTAAPLPVDALKIYPTPDRLDRVAISPDGRQALTAGYDKKARLWDIESGAELKVYDWHKDIVRYVQFSPDGTRAASCGSDKSAVVWDLKSGEIVRRFDDQKGPVWGALFSPEGKRLLTCCEDGTATVWDIDTGEPLQTFTGHTKRINAAAWTPDGQRIATASLDKTARLWDVTNGKELKRYEGHTDGVATLAVSPNGRYLATGSYDNSVRLWELETAKPLHTFDGHKGQVWNVAFSPDNHRLLSGGSDKTVKLWDVEGRQLLQSYEKHTGGVSGVAFHPDNRRALSCSQDKTMILWGLPAN